MLRNACYAVCAAVPIGAVAVALVYPDWQLLSFGVAAVGHVLLLVYAPLLGAIGLLYVLSPHAPAAPAAARRQSIAIAITLFCITASSAAGYAAFLFLCFFNTYAPFLLDPGDMPVRLVWIASIACFPWAHVALIEMNHEPRTVNVDLVLAALTIGCAVIVATIAHTGTPVSLEFILSTFALTMAVGLLAQIRRVW